MNRLELRLKELNPLLFGKLYETIDQVKIFLNEYKNNFPQYTDHSIHHTEEVFKIADEILTDKEIDNLNDDEIYVLSMACYLHDIGMCIPEEKISLISDTEELIRERELHPELKREDYLRQIHHNLSAKFIREEWELLKIPSVKYADAIALVAEGHRVVDISNPDVYKPKYFVKSGRAFVCLPYLSSILRIADELDVTNLRTPSLLTKYYMPDNEKSALEWSKHIANTIRNVSENYVRFEVECSNQSMLASLESQFEKIINVLNYCQKVVRNITNTEDRSFSLKFERVIVDYNYVNFHPKGIKYSFDVDNVINAFVGENLYNDKLTSLREVVQNSIDTCRYKKTLNPENYTPEINIYIEPKCIKIEDNGLGMDTFIVKNFFGKLGSSFYQQENVRKNYEAIGQFGVGVFSYFLIADYIDIETKTDTSETLHFRLDKDPKDYFHFFGEHTRKFSGTTITLYLKKEFQEEDGSRFLNFIKDKFRYIEFPLKLIYNNNFELLTKQNFRYTDTRVLLNNNVRYAYVDRLDEIETFVIDFDYDNFEGSATFLYFKDLSFNHVFNLFRETEDLRRRYELSTVDISQKGVFICKDDRFSFDGSIINLNLKQKIDVQISRNYFSNRKQLEDIFKVINVEIFNAFLSFVKQFVENRSLPLICYNFISKNGVDFSKIVDKIKQDFYLKTISSQNENFSTLSDFLDLKVDEFIITLNDGHTSEILSLSNDVNIVECFYDADIHSAGGYSEIIDIFKYYGYEEVLVGVGNIYYCLMRKGLESHVLKYKSEWYYFVSTENISVVNVDIFYLTDSKREYLYDNYFNIKHPVVENIYSKVKADSVNTKIKSLGFEILDIFLAIKDQRSDQSENNIILANKLIKEIGFDYSLTIKDFYISK